MNTTEPAARVIVAKRMAHVACDWTDTETGEHEHNPDCSNWKAYLDDAAEALREVAGLLAADRPETTPTEAQITAAVYAFSKYNSGRLPATTLRYGLGAALRAAWTEAE